MMEECCVMSASLADLLDERLALHPLGLDDLSAVRHLHVPALRTQTVGVLSDAEIAAFARLAYSPDYGDMLKKERERLALKSAEAQGRSGAGSGGRAGER